jgi:hypothetical protein
VRSSCCTPVIVVYATRKNDVKAAVTATATSSLRSANDTSGRKRTLGMG